MDAFFASIEQRDHPELKGKPLVVGSPDRRGVIAAASYEARKYGIHSAMPSAIAKQKCPNVVFMPHRFSVYKDVSRQINEIFHAYSDLIEPLSLDEAFIDVTSNKMGMDRATEIAQAIRNEILNQTQLTASAGISYNKFLAKLATDINKPNGQKLIHPEKAQAFIDQLPIEAFFGVGKATSTKMHKAGIFIGEDLKCYSQEALVYLFGKQGVFFYSISRGIDEREVKPSRKRKSLSAERTLKEDLIGKTELFYVLEKIAEEVSKRAKKSNYKGRTISIKFKYFDFEQHTRSKTIGLETNNVKELLNTAMGLLDDETLLIKPIRLLGITLSNPTIELIKPKQTTLNF